MIKLIFKTQDEELTFMGQTSKEGLDLIRTCRNVAGGATNGIIHKDGSACVSGGDIKVEAIPKPDYAQAYREFVKGA